MNAMPPRPIDPEAAARTARHLRHLEELAELGMAMARAVAGAALHPPPAPDAAAPPEATPAAPRAPHRKGDPGLVFARLALAVRQTIALEARIVAERDNPSGRRPPPPPPDPRRALLRRAFRDAADPGTGGAADPSTGGAAATGFRREVDERIEEELAADPGGQIPIEDILDAICDDLGIDLDLSQVPDEVLGIADPEPADPEQEPPGSPGPPLHRPTAHGPDPP